MTCQRRATRCSASAPWSGSAQCPSRRHPARPTADGRARTRRCCRGRTAAPGVPSCVAAAHPSSAGACQLFASVTKSTCALWARPAAAITLALPSSSMLWYMVVHVRYMICRSYPQLGEGALPASPGKQIGAGDANSGLHPVNSPRGGLSYGAICVVRAQVSIGFEGMAWTAAMPLPRCWPHPNLAHACRSQQLW
jgi:hypothetical protein